MVANGFTFQRYVKTKCAKLNSFIICNLCQQSFKAKCTEYNESLEEIPKTAPESFRCELEIKDVYGGMLDDLNAKYERLLSLLQTLLDNTKDTEINREVSHSTLTFLRVFMFGLFGHGRKKNRPWSWARVKLPAMCEKFAAQLKANGFLPFPNGFIVGA